MHLNFISDVTALVLLHRLLHKAITLLGQRHGS